MYANVPLCVCVCVSASMRACMHKCVCVCVISQLNNDNDQIAPEHEQAEKHNKNQTVG